MGNSVGWIVKFPGLPELKLKNKGSLKDIYGQRRHFVIEEKPALVRQENNREKVFVLQKVRFTGEYEHVKELRLGYYIIGKKGRMRGRWAWGQFCPLLPAGDFKRVIREARKLGWLD